MTSSQLARVGAVSALCSVLTAHSTHTELATAALQLMLAELKLQQSVGLPSVEGSVHVVAASVRGGAHQAAVVEAVTRAVAANPGASLVQSLGAEIMTFITSEST